MQKKITESLSKIEDMLTINHFRPLSFKEAQKYLGVSPSFLYKMTSKGKIRHYKPSGKLIFFDKQDLDSWIQKNPVITEEELNCISSNYSTKNASKSLVKKNALVSARSLK